MTVSTTISRKAYAGDGGSVAFPTTFEFFDAADLTVILIDSAGTATVQTLTTHYTVSGGSGSTGTVTMVTAPASGETLVILLDEDLTQTADFTPGGTFPASSFENALDRLAMVNKQQQDAIDRSIKIPDEEAPAGFTLTLPNAATRADSVIVFDANGDVSTSQTIAQSTTEAQAAAAAAAASQVAALASEDNAEDWATLLDAQVEATDYSSKEYAIGTTVPTGSSKEWANQPEDVAVGAAAGFSALHYAAKAQAAAAALTIPDTVIYYHPQTQLTDVTVPAGYNAWVVGPFSIDAGATLTVGAGSNFYVQPDPSTLVTDAEYAAGADVDYLTPATAANTYAPKFRGARLVLSSNFSGQTNYNVVWDSASFDTDSFWSAGTPTILTIPAGVSKVEIFAHGSVESTVGNNTSINFNISKSPSTSIVSEGTTVSSAFVGTNRFSCSSGPLSVSEGDTFFVNVQRAGTGTIGSISLTSWGFSIRVIE